MASLEKRFNDWLNSPAGKKTREKMASESSRSSSNIDDIENRIRKCIESGLEYLPFDTMVYISEPKSNDDGSVSVEVYLDHEMTQRDSLLQHPIGDSKPSLKSYNKYVAEYGSDPDLLFIINNGIDFTEKAAPFGIWHGQATSALSYRDGERFIQQIAKSIEQELGGGATVTYNPDYDK